MNKKNIYKIKKITVIVNGRFHAFDYAAELHKLGLLHKLISSMPYSKAKQFEIPKSLYAGNPILELIKVFFRKIFKKEVPVNWYAKKFTIWAEKKVPVDSEVIISFAGYSKEIFESPKYKNSFKILDRGSTHTLENIVLKKQASQYHNTPFQAHSEEFVKREIAEYELADRILVPSSFVANTFIAHKVPAKKLIVNPYAISTQKFSKSNLRLSRMEGVILFVGQISPRKGVKVLIDAFLELRKEIPTIRLWMVGALNGLPESLLNHEGISYFGVLRGDELKAKFEQATLFCLPSFEEGLALVLTEAKFFGLPIVATPNSGIEELFDGQTEGYSLFKAGDHIDLKNKLKKRLMKQQNRKVLLVEQRTWKQFIEDILNSIENVTV